MKGTNYFDQVKLEKFQSKKIKTVVLFYMKGNAKGIDTKGNNLVNFINAVLMGAFITWYCSLSQVTSVMYAHMCTSNS